MSELLARELARATAKVAKLERAVAKENAQQLAGLPAKYGFNTLREFIAAVKAAGAQSKGPRVKPGATEPATTGKKRKRATVTEAVKNQVAELVKAGKPGSAIARQVGISLLSVQNVKKSLGLVKARKAKVAKPAKAEKTGKSAKIEQPEK